MVNSIPSAFGIGRIFLSQSCGHIFRKLCERVYFWDFYHPVPYAPLNRLPSGSRDMPVFPLKLVPNSL